MTEISEAVLHMLLVSWLKMAQNPWIARFMSKVTLERNARNKLYQCVSIQALLE